MTHATLDKFGYPDTLIRDYEHWCVVLRPKQATLGALVLIAKSDATEFAALPENAFTEMKRVTADIEAVLKDTFAYDKINYLMLMMVDPQVHFHVLPRYGEVKIFEGNEAQDPGWPGPPDLKHNNDLGGDGFKALLKTLQDNWPE